MACDCAGPSNSFPEGNRAQPPVFRFNLKRQASSDGSDTGISRKKVKRAEPNILEDYRERNTSEERVITNPSQGRVPVLTSGTGKGCKRKFSEREQEVRKWWMQGKNKKDNGIKWNFLEHNGPVFAPPYEPLPPSVKFLYNGKAMKLSRDAEEVATFYCKMLDHEYTSKETFNRNFFRDWQTAMNPKERRTITDLDKCDFRNMCSYFKHKAEQKKALSKEQKKKIKEENERVAQKHGFCTLDGQIEKVGNYKIEPPGLFRGRGEHPKMGKLKKRVTPEDVVINCSKNSKWPVPPKGHKWKEVRHDNTVTWLASWTENIHKQVKYIMLNPSSKPKAQMTWQKYETARQLGKHIRKIREDYTRDLNCKNLRIRQRAVAMYFIDKLALRAGNEKSREERADTVGCCSLRVEHLKLCPQKNGEKYVVIFDFPGKDCIRYYNAVPVDRKVFESLQLFMKNKRNGDYVFDQLNTGTLNKHLNELMEGLTAKVFRTYNASFTLQCQLIQLTRPGCSTAEKILAYNRANRSVAILCNHQRSIPKNHEKSMRNLKDKIEKKKAQVRQAELQYRQSKRSCSSTLADRKKRVLDRLKEQLRKLTVMEADREENKNVALGTSKLNYLDPRITIAWCKRTGVPLEKIYNKTQRERFRWAIETAKADFVF